MRRILVKVFVWGLCIVLPVWLVYELFTLPFWQVLGGLLMAGTGYAIGRLQ